MESETKECSMLPCTGKLSIMAPIILNYHYLEHNQGTMVRELNKKGIPFQDSKLPQYF